jgi:hypothetical protein
VWLVRRLHGESNGGFEDGTEAAKIAGSVRVQATRNGPTSGLSIHRRSDPDLCESLVPSAID